MLKSLTRHSASAVGLVMALQFGPQLLLLPWTGLAADWFDQRRLLLVTQAAIGLLGLPTLSGCRAVLARLCFRLTVRQRCGVDAPVRQTFVGQLVGDADLPNAVALNATSFNAARMTGPALAGTVITIAGTGWAFLFNGLSFLAVLASLGLLRIAELHPSPRAARMRGGFLGGVRYVWSRPDLRAVLIMLFLIGTFSLNFSIFISTMAVRGFGADAAGFGLLSSVMAVGTVGGALFNAGRDNAGVRTLRTAALPFGVGCGLAARAPGYWLFAAALVVIGCAALTFTNTTNRLMQLATEPAMRSRVNGAAGRRRTGGARRSLAGWRIIAARAGRWGSVPPPGSPRPWPPCGTSAARRCRPDPQTKNLPVDRRVRSAGLATFQ